MIKVIKKAAVIIDIVHEEKSISFSDIHNLSGLNRSTVSHILTTLFKINYLDKDKSGSYIMGKKLSSYCSGLNYKTVLMDIASRATENLLERINELTVIAMYYKGMRLTLIKKRPDKNLQVAYKEKTNPASWYTTASGRLLLACQDQIGRENIISKIGLPVSKVWHEARSHDSLIKELDKIKEKECAIRSIDETVDMIAKPMPDAEGNYCFSISCALPVMSYDKISQVKVLEHMEDVAKQFSTEIKLNNIKASDVVFQEI